VRALGGDPVRVGDHLAGCLLADAQRVDKAVGAAAVAGE